MERLIGEGARPAPCAVGVESSRRIVRDLRRVEPGLQADDPGALVSRERARGQGVIARCAVGLGVERHLATVPHDAGAETKIRRGQGTAEDGELTGRGVAVGIVDRIDAELGIGRDL